MKINACYNLMTFYFSAVLGITCNIIVNWTLQSFESVYWIVPYQTATFADALMALAYSTIMLELSGKIRILEQVIEMECTLDRKVEMEQILKRRMKMFLFMSVIVLFVVFVPMTTWLGIVVYQDNTRDQRLDVYKVSTTVEWSVFSLISVLLMGSGLYAISSLRRLFGSSFNSEICWL